MEDNMRKMAASFAAFDPFYTQERRSDAAPAEFQPRSRASDIADAHASEYTGACGVAVVWVAFYAIIVAAALLQAA